LCWSACPPLGTDYKDAARKSRRRAISRHTTRQSAGADSANSGGGFDDPILNGLVRPTLSRSKSTTLRIAVAKFAAGARRGGNARRRAQAYPRRRPPPPAASAARSSAGNRRRWDFTARSPRETCSIQSAANATKLELHLSGARYTRHPNRQHRIRVGRGGLCGRRPGHRDGTRAVGRATTSNGLRGQPSCACRVIANDSPAESARETWILVQGAGLNAGGARHRGWTRRAPSSQVEKTSGRCPGAGRPASSCRGYPAWRC